MLEEVDDGQAPCFGFWEGNMDRAIGSNVVPG